MSDVGVVNEAAVSDVVVVNEAVREAVRAKYEEAVRKRAKRRVGGANLGRRESPPARGLRRKSLEAPLAVSSSGLGRGVAREERWPGVAMCSEDEVEELREVACGGSCRVSVCRVGRLGVVAMKEAQSAAGEVELRREARVLSGPGKHADIVAVLAVVQTPGRFAVVLPLYTRSLRARLDEGRALSAAEMRVCASAVLRALVHLHESAKLVHGDVKALNVLVREDGGAIVEAVLCDLGSAYTFDRPSCDPRSVGTTRWMAPEVVRCSSFLSRAHGAPPPPPCPSADVWSYGMLLYELVSLLVPYADLSLDRVCAAILSGALPSFVEPSSPYASILWDVLLDCLSIDPLSRPTLSSLLPRISTFYCESGTVSSQ